MKGPIPADCAQKYEVIRRIASGGFGAVFEARHRELGRPAAIKVLLQNATKDPDHVVRFVNEARITASLSHANIVEILDHGADHGIPWIAYELLEGRNLRQLLDAEEVSFETAISACLQVAGALEEAHSHGIHHRDIKPDNVLEVGAGAYKLTDFGIAKWCGEGAVETRHGVILGTPAYLSPEQILGEPASPSSDLYALGIMLFELLTGKPPFDHPNPGDLLEMHLRSPVPRPGTLIPGLPRSVDRVVERALAKEPGQRFASARELMEALAELKPAEGPQSATRRDLYHVPRGVSTRVMALSGPAQEVRAPAGTGDPQRPSRQRVWPGALAGGLVLGFVIFLTVSLSWKERHSVASPSPGLVEPSGSPAIPASPSPAASPPSRDLKLTQQWQLVTDADLVIIGHGGSAAWEAIERLQRSLTVHITHRQDEMQVAKARARGEPALLPNTKRLVDSLRHWRNMGRWLAQQAERAPSRPPPRSPYARRGLMDDTTRLAAIEVSRKAYGNPKEQTYWRCFLGLYEYPDEWSFWMMMGEFLRQDRQRAQASVAFEAGLALIDDSAVPSQPVMAWVSLARSMFWYRREQLYDRWWTLCASGGKSQDAWILLQNALTPPDAPPTRPELMQCIELALEGARKLPEYRDRVPEWLVQLHSRNRHPMMH